MRMLLLLAALALSACSSSTAPTPAPTAAPTVTEPASKPVATPTSDQKEAKAIASAPADETAAAKAGAPPSAPDVHLVPVEKDVKLPPTPAAAAHVTVHPTDTKHPLHCAPPDKADGSCTEKADGSLEFKGKDAKPGGS